MTRNSIRLYLSLGIISVMALSLVLWVMPALADHKAQATGVLVTDPTTVSPDEANVTTADRTITITLTDPNLNGPLFVGTGPNGETADPSVSGVNGATLASGDRITVGADGVTAVPPNAPGPFLVALAANPIGPGGSTPMADSDDDGDIDINDIFIVDADCNDDGFDDISVASLFDGSRGLVNFTMVQAGCGGQGFEVRYATPGVSLTRATKVFPQELATPGTGVIGGESFSVALGATLQDTDAGGAVNSGDVTVNAGAVTIGGLSGNTITLTATAVLNTGDQSITLDYLGREVLTVPANGTGDFDIALANAISGDLGAIAVVAGPGGGATGDVAGFGLAGQTVTFRPATALTSGDTFTVEYAGRETVTVPETGIHNTERFTLEIKLANLPLQDTDASGAVDNNDITVTVSGRTATDTPVMTGIGQTFVLVVTSADKPTGLAAGNQITLVGSGDALPLGTSIFVEYLGFEDLVTVTGADPADKIPLRLRETGPDTGVFEATVIAIDGDLHGANVRNANLNPGGEARPELAVFSDLAITVRYGDRLPVKTITARIDVESDPPTFDSTSPDEGAITNFLDTVLTTVASDLLAGVASTVETSVNVNITIDTIPEDVSSGDITITETFDGSGAYTISYNINNISKIADAITNSDEINAVVTWEITVKDKAGNEGSTSPLVDGVRVPKKLNVDNRKPKVNSATANSVTSITVTFDRAMEAASFQPSDFLVDGNVPSAVLADPDDPASVILTVTLAGPSATPRVQVVGEVQDLGGNVLDVSDAARSDVPAALDAIAPTLSVTIADTYTKGEISISASSNEPIVGILPSGIRTINLCTANATGDLVCAGVPSYTLTTSFITQQEEWSFSLAGFGMGRYNIEMDVRDGNTNTGTAGNADPTDADALTFEIDTSLPGSTPSVPSNTLTDTFVVLIDWRSEGTEYAGDTHADVTITKATLDEGTADERNVLAQASTRDNQNFSVAIPNVGLGDHTLTFNGTDELGNTLAEDASLEFTVTEPPPFSLSLQPGMNLVSIPGEPEAGSINTVFGAVPEVDLIFTREGGIWLTAFRDPLAPTTFIGNLSSIDSRHAYWIRTTATVAVDLKIPPLAANQLLPVISVRGGEWNLVPVISLLPIGDGVGEIQQSSTINAKDYLGENWSRTFTFDSGRWVPVTSLDNVEVGRGYWVFFITNDRLVP